MGPELLDERRGGVELGRQHRLDGPVDVVGRARVEQIAVLVVNHVDAPGPEEQTPHRAQNVGRRHLASQL
jgi:hypothetical protein